MDSNCCCCFHNPSLMRVIAYVIIRRLGTVPACDCPMIVLVAGQIGLWLLHSSLAFWRIRRRHNVWIFFVSCCCHDHIRSKDLEIERDKDSLCSFWDRKTYKIVMKSIDPLTIFYFVGEGHLSPCQTRSIAARATHAALSKSQYQNIAKSMLKRTLLWWMWWIWSQS